MHRLRFGLLLGLFTLLLLAPLTLAADLDPCVGSASSFQCQAAGLGFGAVLGQIVQFIFVVAVILALGFLVYGGVRWITSGGDKTNVANARNTIVAAIIGLILVFLAYIVLNLVLRFLTGSDIGGIRIPTLGACQLVEQKQPDNTIFKVCEPTDKCENLNDLDQPEADLQKVTHCRLR